MTEKLTAFDQADRLKSERTRLSSEQLYRSLGAESNPRSRPASVPAEDPVSADFQVQE